MESRHSQWGQCECPGKHRLMRRGVGRGRPVPEISPEWVATEYGHRVATECEDWFWFLLLTAARELLMTPI